MLTSPQHYYHLEIYSRGKGDRIR